MRAACALSACVLVALAGCRSPGERAVADTFKASVWFLDELTSAPANAVPDAVLNRARCVIVTPYAVRTRARANAAASCRDEEGRWQMPAFVQFTAAAAPTGDILVFVLSERGAKQLTTRGLRLGTTASARAGPVLQTTATVTDAELSADAVSYQQSKGAIRGSAVAGMFVVNPPGPQSMPAGEARQLQRAITSYFNTITPIGIIIHHSAVIPGDARMPENTGEVDAFHRERGFDILCSGRDYHVAYHYLILPNGSVKAGRPERCQGAHARGYNSYLGIAVFGDFSSVDNPRGEKGEMNPTPRQMQSLVKLCRRLMERYGIPLQRVMRHSDVASTRCPGDRFPFAGFLRVVQSGRRNP